MSAEEILRSNEDSALEETQIISRVTGQKSKNSGSKLKKSFSAAGFITAMIVIFTFLFSSGNLIPSAISERLVEETDVQYADAVESKIAVFQQALFSGEVPENTARRLKENGVLVGEEKNGEFVETNKTSGNLSLKIDNKVVSAGDFATEANDNVKLYNAFNTATYSRAAYYYDRSAERVFERLGASRNNFSGDESFEEVMTKVVGQGSDIDINNVGLYEKRNENDEIYYEYGTVGAGAGSQSAAEVLVENVRSKNMASNSTQATLNAASALNTADTIAKEQKSSTFFLAFMENISKMKAGLGNKSKINEAMNYLYQEEETEVVDAKTGEVIKVSGSMLESPSLYAMLSGERIDVSKVANYSSDRVLKTVEGQLGADSANGAVNETVASSAKGIRGSIGRFISWGEAALSNVLSKITPTVNSSLVNNSFKDIKGVAGGELLVEGAVNVGKELAKASGATAGDATAVKSYARLTNSVLALDAKADRMNRSPFDITSKNTFLGSIMHSLAVEAMKTGSLFSKMASITRVTAKAMGSIMPVSYADDESEAYLTNFGDCETLSTIGAVGSAGCTMVATFDTTTLDNVYNDAGFINFVETNTVLSNGVRTIKSGSTLANFITYNDERITPAGVVDGGILESTGGQSISFISDILRMVRRFLGASEGEKRLASGAAFVNSSSNGDWNTYKYAQRYVSLARATEALRQYDGGRTAYSNIKCFEGEENPVIAFLESYYNIASRAE